MKEFYGNYLGVVITGGENDPEYRGRAQVFVPHVMPALYEQWNKEGKDISFEVIGVGLDGALDPKIVSRLKNILPWAECAAPIVGSSPSYKGDSNGFVAEVTRNVGKAASAVKDIAKNAWNTLAGNSESTDPALGIGLAGYLGSVDRNEAGYCGRGVRNLLINAYGYSESQIPGANGQDFEPILEKQGWTKQYVSNPKDAPDGSIAVYQSDQRLGKPLTTRKDGSPTGGSTAGHVEVKAGDKFFFGAGGGKNNFGGSQGHNYPGYVLVPPPEIKNKLLKKAGLPVPDISPSAIPYHATNTTNMDPDTTKEKTLGEGLNQQIKLSLSQDVNLQAASSKVNLNDQVTLNSSSSLSQDAYGRINPNEFKSYLEQRLASSPLTQANNGKGYVPTDGAKYGIDGSPRSWANYLSKLAQKESGKANNGKSDSNGWPSAQATYQESFSNSKGEKVLSSGLFMVSVESVRGYGIGKGLSDAELQQKLFDPAFNIDAAIAIHEKQVLKHGKIEMNPSKGDEHGKGAGGYFASASMAKIKADVAAGKVDSFNPSVAASAPMGTNQPIIKTPTPHQGISGPNTNNQALGMFGYASEGQAVWVFFREGNPLCPVYFAASFGSKEWGGIYQNASPGIGNGKPGTEKMSLNSYGGGFTSFASTEESSLGANFGFQIYDKNGSNLTFAKDHTQFNSLYNHIQRVAGDSHDITETNKEIRVKGNYNTYAEQDVFVTVGNWSQEAIDASDEIQKIINEGMKLYEES